MARTAFVAFVAWGALAFAGSAQGSPFAYVANDDDTVTVVDLDGNRVRGTFPIGGEPKDVVVAPDGRKAYFATDVGLVVLDTRMLQASTVPLPAPAASSVAIEPDGSRVFVSHRFTRDLSTYATSNGAVGSLAMPHSAVRHLAMSPLGDFLWGVTDAGDVDRLDVRSDVSQSVFTGQMPMPSGIAVDAFGSVWLGSGGNRQVKVFSVSPTNGAAGALLLVSNDVVPGRIGIDRAGGSGAVALVTRPNDDRIDRWFGATLHLPGGTEPVDVDASADRVIVSANEGPGSSGAPLGHGSITVVSPAGVETQLPGGDDPVAVAVGPRMWAEIEATPSAVGLYYYASGTYRGTITIRPSAWDALQIGTLRFGAATTAFSLQNDACSGRRIEPGSACTVEVVFSYTRPAGYVFGRTYQTTVEVPSNAQNAPVKTVPVTASYGFCCLQPRPGALAGFGG